MAGALMLLLSAAAIAAPAVPLERKTVSLALANELASAAIASCRATGREAVVAVVDRGGNLVALQRGDDVGPHNTLAAQRKAFTALSTKTSTSTLADRAASDPTSRNLVTVPELLLLRGGQPLSVAGDVIGAIGVAGAGGAPNDDRCASEANSKVLPASKPRS
ncbi:MAG: hypothetical protein DCF31_12585 [Alphaproteobacteria bacterium]|nr:MAG: hypothetical protein DCF31_12585 [Alphaproteobacteria bacterium]